MAILEEEETVVTWTKGMGRQNGRQPIGCRDKMAVREFNQYLPPSFVVGGGQGKTQKGPGT